MTISILVLFVSCAVWDTHGHEFVYWTIIMCISLFLPSDSKYDDQHNCRTLTTCQTYCLTKAWQWLSWPHDTPGHFMSAARNVCVCLFSLFAVPVSGWKQQIIFWKVTFDWCGNCLFPSFQLLLAIIQRDVHKACEDSCLLTVNG